jgi:RNA polymerase sigma-70 factor (ECF subfamily)
MDVRILRFLLSASVRAHPRPGVRHFTESGSAAVWRKENSAEDQVLVSRCQSGDETAFEELVLKYQQTLFNIIYHNMGHHGDAEDIAQKIFSKVYFSLMKFDNNRPFFPWMYRIAVNQCYDEMRRNRRRRSLTFSELNLDEAENIENLIKQDAVQETSAEERKDLHDLLYKMLNKLPEKQRKALVLRDLEDVPYEKMAEVMLCTEQAARLKVFRARTRLRDMMLKAMRRREHASVRP